MCARIDELYLHPAVFLESVCWTFFRLFTVRSPTPRNVRFCVAAESLPLLPGGERLMVFVVVP